MASDDDFQSSSLTKRKVRRSYLVTYSQADLEKFPTRESFGKVVVTAFANFVLSRSSKALSDLISNTWKMESAASKVSRKSIPRMDVIRSQAEKECVDGCGGLWLECAIQVLEQNKVHPVIFAEAMRELLVKGRGKYRNVMIVGPANCAKTFLLRPLQTLFDTFSNPSNDKYAWLGAETAEMIFLNDFRWSSEMIAWKELLLLLEGQPVHLPAPKNHYATDICISADIPILATAKSRIVYQGKYNTSDSNDMMAARWKVFEFFQQIPEEEQKDIIPCPKCFSTLTLTGEL